MGGPYKRKKYHDGDVHLKRGWRTKSRTKDFDQIETDLQDSKVTKLLSQPIDLEKAGQGQFYCVHCAKHLISANAFSHHVRGKPHKRRLHALRTEAYTVEESERAAGLGSYHGPQKRKRETLLPEALKPEKEENKEVKEEEVKEETKNPKRARQEVEEEEEEAEKIEVDDVMPTRRSKRARK